MRTLTNLYELRTIIREQIEICIMEMREGTLKEPMDGALKALDDMFAMLFDVESEITKLERKFTTFIWRKIFWR